MRKQCWPATTMVPDPDVRTSSQRGWPSCCAPGPSTVQPVVLVLHPTHPIFTTRLLVAAALRASWVGCFGTCSWGRFAGVRVGEKLAGRREAHGARTCIAGPNQALWPWEAIQESHVCKGRFCKTSSQTLEAAHRPTVAGEWRQRPSRHLCGCESGAAQGGLAPSPRPSAGCTSVNGRHNLQTSHRRAPCRKPALTSRAIGRVGALRFGRDAWSDPQRKRCAEGGMIRAEGWRRALKMGPDAADFPA